MCARAHAISRRYNMALAGMGLVLGVLLVFVVLPTASIRSLRRRALRMQGEEALREDLLIASTLQARARARHSPPVVVAVARLMRLPVRRACRFFFCTS